MTQWVELLLDDAADQAVRAQWQTLLDAGLPSQARHAGASNRPHVTLAAQARIDPSVDDALRSAVAGLPLRLRLGAVGCFGRDPFVLFRLVVPDAALLRLQQEVATTLGVEADGHFGPGRWSPHVTLASRMSAADVAEALRLLGGTGELAGSAVRCRRWDSQAKQEESLTPR